MNLVKKIKNIKTHYYKKNKYDYINSSKKFIFILGTGRSGTHWIGNILGNHNEVYTTVEKEPIFSYVTYMALNPNLRPDLFPELIKCYKKELSNTNKNFYLDKSHPNLWLAESLNNIFPNSLFIAIKRNPYATVASMLNHKGVLKWHNEYKKFPLPNSFLGIKNNLIDKYDDLPLSSKCALRWKAHVDKINDLENKLNEKLLVIEYESLIQNNELELEKIKNFLSLKSDIPKPNIKKNSLNKWKDNLTNKQIEHITKIIS